MATQQDLVLRVGILVGLTAWAAYPSQVVQAQTNSNDSPERRAVAFLAEHVPRWQRENNCFSCHNNGDAARALIQSHALGLLKNPAPLDDTLAFLINPEQWDANGPDGPFKDQKLARIQFAAALTEAVETGMIPDRGVLNRAAQLVAEIQEPDGGWPSDAPGTIGSPVTYGRPLATWLALRTLQGSKANEHAARISKSIARFENQEPKSVLDAAATLLALAKESSPAAAARRKQALALIKAGQSNDGGWGPFASSPPEVFDTAIVLLALSVQPDRDAFEQSIARGRSYLIARQSADGSWPPTTRPPGANSYAQQLSTTGWATQALLATAVPKSH
jgi:hypothetical protein